MQLIKVRAGRMQTLLDSGPVDLSKMGSISVHRSSEILFDEGQQKYYISFLEPKLRYRNGLMRDQFFPTYKEAVAEEIKIINDARRSGIL